MDKSLWKQAAQESVEKAGTLPRRQFFLYSAVVAAVSLVASVMQKLLLMKIDNGSGLSALGSVTVLQTVSLVVSLLPAVLQPFWTVGLARYTLELSRGNADGDLLEGFRRFKPVLSAGIFRLGQYFMLGFPACFLGIQLFLFTPMAQPLLAAITQEGTELSTALPTDEAMLACFGMVLAVYILLCAPLFYRYRMVDFLITDGDGVGGFQALFLSGAITRKRRLKLLGLDLSFWWVYALLALASLVTNAPGLLNIPGEPAYWGCLVLGLAMEVAIYTFAMPKVAVTYAHCYESYRQEPAAEPAINPKNRPWNGWQ